MKKLACMMMIASCHVYGMDKLEEQKTVVVQEWQDNSRYCRQVKPEVAQRHNVRAFHKQLHQAVIFKRQDEVQQLLQSAGTDATELVSSLNTKYGFGTVLDLTFIENKSEIRKILWHYLDNDARKKCFEWNKNYCHHELWATESYKMGLMSNLPVVRILRYLNRKNPVEFPLESHELEQLNSDIEKWQSKK